MGLLKCSGIARNLWNLPRDFSWYWCQTWKFTSRISIRMSNFKGVLFLLGRGKEKHTTRIPSLWVKMESHKDIIERTNGCGQWKIVSSCSWTWRKLLQLRHYIWSSVSASFWYSHGASSLVLSIIVFGHGHSFLFLPLISSEPQYSWLQSFGRGCPFLKNQASHAWNARRSHYPRRLAQSSLVLKKHYQTWF